ncbi:hypothetical protein ACLOJK_023974 [Asimina triloba]
MGLPTDHPSWYCTFVAVELSISADVGQTDTADGSKVSCRIFKSKTHCSWWPSNVAAVTDDEEEGFI